MKLCICCFEPVEDEDSELCLACEEDRQYDRIDEDDAYGLSEWDILDLLHGD